MKIDSKKEKVTPEKNASDIKVAVVESKLPGAETISDQQQEQPFENQKTKRSKTKARNEKLNEGVETAKKDKNKSTKNKKTIFKVGGKAKEKLPVDEKNNKNSEETRKNMYKIETKKIANAEEVENNLKELISQMDQNAFDGLTQEELDKLAMAVKKSTLSILF